MEDEAADTVTGLLGVPHLRQPWLRTVRSGGHGGPASAVEWAADRAVIYGLGLGLHETLTFLHAVAAPSFASFERWVLDRNGGAIDAALIGTTQFRGRASPRRSAASSRRFARGFCACIRRARSALLGGERLRRAAATRSRGKPVAMRGAGDLGLPGHGAGRPGKPVRREELRRNLCSPGAQHPAFARNRHSPRASAAPLPSFGELKICRSRSTVAGSSPPGRPAAGDFPARDCTGTPAWPCRSRWIFMGLPI